MSQDTVPPSTPSTIKQPFSTIARSSKSSSPLSSDTVQQAIPTSTEPLKPNVTVESVNHLVLNLFQSLGVIRTDIVGRMDRMDTDMQQLTSVMETMNKTVSHRFEVLEASLNSVTDAVSKRSESSSSSSSPVVEPPSTDPEAEFETKLRQLIYAFADTAIELHLNSTLEKGKVLKTWNAWFPEDTDKFHINADRSILFHKILGERIGPALNDGSGRKRRYQQVRWKPAVSDETIGKVLGVKHRLLHGVDEEDETEDEEPPAKRVKNSRERVSGYSGQLSSEEVLRLRALLNNC
jgi:hypothetical protein